MMDKIDISAHYNSTWLGMGHSNCNKWQIHTRNLRTGVILWREMKLSGLFAVTWKYLHHINWVRISVTQSNEIHHISPIAHMMDFWCLKKILISLNCLPGEKQFFGFSWETVILEIYLQYVYWSALIEVSCVFWYDVSSTILTFFLRKTPPSISTQMALLKDAHCLWSVTYKMSINAGTVIYDKTTWTQYFYYHNHLE